MPDITISQALTANQVGFRPLASWRYRRLPYRALITIIARGTTAGIRVVGMAGTTEQLQRSPVQAGGTAGSTPVPNTTPVFQFYADPFDEIDLAFDEVLAGTPTLDAWVNAEPA